MFYGQIFQNTVDAYKLNTNLKYRKYGFDLIELQIWLSNSQMRKVETLKFKISFQNPNIEVLNRISMTYSNNETKFEKFTSILFLRTFTKLC